MFTTLWLAWVLASGPPNAAPSLQHLPQPDNWVALHAELQSAGVAFPQFFTRIAVVETGWDFREGVGAHHNLFGMQARIGKPATWNGYAVYAHRLEAIQDLKLWIAQDPPTLWETPEAYLQRRKWNPYAQYWAYLRTVDPFREARLQLAQLLRPLVGAGAGQPLATQ
jgi:hypothetical protein